MSIAFTQIINDEFASSIKKRGKELFDSGAVQFIDLDYSQKRLTGTVMGTRKYQISLLFNEAKNRINTCLCSCPYAYYCKHQVALLYRAQKLYGGQVASDDDVNAEPPGGQPAKKVHRRPTKRNAQKKGLPKKMSRSDFIPLEFSSIRQVLARYGSKRISTWVHDMQSELTIDPQYNLVVSIKRGWRGFENSELLAQVVVKPVELGYTSIKCSVCHEEDKYLCNHMQIALSYIDDTSTECQISKPKSYYDDIYRKTAESLSLSPADFAKYFKLILRHGLPTPQALIPDLIMDSDNYSFVQKEAFSDKQEIIRLTNAALKENSFSYALEWLTEDQYLVSLIKGKLRKRDGVLTTQIQEGYDVQQLPQHLIGLYQKLSSLESDSEYIDSEYGYFSKIHSILLQHHEILMLDKHYYYDPAYSRSLFGSKKNKYFRHFSFTDELVQLKATATLTDGLYQIRFHMVSDHRTLALDQIAFHNRHLVIFKEHNNEKEQGYIYTDYAVYNMLSQIIATPRISFLPKDKDLLIEQIALLKHHIDFDIDPAIEIETDTITNAKKSIFLSQEDQSIFIEPRMGDDQSSISILAETCDMTDEKIVELDGQELSQFITEIESLHPEFKNQVHEYGFLFLNTAQFIKDLWFYDFYEACQKYDIEIFGQENLNDLNYSRHKASISSSIKSGIDWFDVDVSMSFGDQAISNKAWINAIKSNQKFIKLDDGSRGVIPEEWFSKLKQLHSNTELINNELKISKFNFNLIDELFEDIDDEPTILEIAKKRKRIASLKSPDIKKKTKIPKAITATLRPYQQQGYNWLRFLHEYDFGGILADDMGLGKTVQVLSILAFALENNPAPNLIIVPRSLLFNWAKEIEKFAPTISHLIHHGANRDKSKAKGKPLRTHQIIISTYDTVASDITIFQKLKLNYIVLDESQAIKNPSSKRYKAMRLLQCEHRLTMTGTPIENNTFDLYAQMSFVNPGCFGSVQKFKERYSTPIDVHGDQEAAQMLKQVIYPFLLRRTKEQVATDLPEKTESVIYCEMSSDQRKKYEQLKKAIKQDVHKMIEAEGLNRSRFKILEGLLRLRQLCNSPKILEAGSKTSATKIDKLEELLTGDLADKNVLIFSQFVSMLGIIKESLTKLKKNFAYLDGQTRDREAAVSEFIEDDDCHIFLISLKAGNTGLNLTKADYVFIVDPWWNPAVEAQAIDRTHRIGQDKQVFAYRLICTDTIEEKIMTLKEKKKKVAGEIISVDDESFKSLDKDQILQLFE